MEYLSLYLVVGTSTVPIRQVAVSISSKWEEYLVNCANGVKSQQQEWRGILANTGCGWKHKKPEPKRYWFWQTPFPPWNILYPVSSSIHLKRIFYSTAYLHVCPCIWLVCTVWHAYCHLKNSKQIRTFQWLNYFLLLQTIGFVFSEKRKDIRVHTRVALFSMRITWK